MVQKNVCLGFCVGLSTLCSSSLHYKEFGCHIKGYPLLSKLAEHNVLKPTSVKFKHNASMGRLSLALCNDVPIIQV